MGISDLSDDLLISVLVRLPIECIVQFKCVSKPWNSLISSPNFIKSHLIQSRIVQKPNVLSPELFPGYIETRRGGMFGQEEAIDSVTMYEFSITGESEYMDFDCSSTLLYRLPELLDSRFITQIVGSSNGLLCLLLSFDHKCWQIYSGDDDEFGNDDSFVLCNPLTKLTWNLPGNKWKKCSRDHTLYGFGFDDVNDVYKVVVLNRVHEKKDILVYECQVYSLNSNSWSKVTSYLEDSSCDFSCDFNVSIFDVCCGVLFNSALHWILLCDRRKPKLILALDLATYKLKILPFPIVLEANDCFKLTVLDGSLVLWNKDSDKLLWMMKRDSWMKIAFTTSCSRTSLEPLALLKDNHKRILISLDCGSCNSLHFTDIVSYQDLRIEYTCDFSSARQLQFVGSLVQPYPPSVVQPYMPSVDFEKLIFSEEDGFEKFRIHVNGVSIDSQLPEHVRRDYYDLCCSMKSFLHERLVPGIRSEVAVSMICGAVNIANFIRSFKLTTSKEEIESTGELVRSLLLLGMNVGFLCERRRCLLELASNSKIVIRDYTEMKSERDQIEVKIEDLEKKLENQENKLENIKKELVGWRRAREKCGNDVYARKLKLEAEKHKLRLQELANAPWDPIMCDQDDALEPFGESYRLLLQEKANASW